MNTETTWRTLRSLVPEPGQAYSWADCCEALPRLLALETTPQDPIHHAEGNVGIHTRMVLDELLADPAWQGADADARLVMFMAALLHDLCKPETTRIDEATGRISQPGHSRRGAIDVRKLFWLAGAPFALREDVCRIISVHQVPFHAFSSRKGESAERIVRTLSWFVPLQPLIVVARADMRGRHAAERERCLADIELFEMLAAEEGCLHQPRAAASEHTRVAYARGAEVHLETPLFGAQGSRVTVLSGLPASGKDTWVGRHGSGRPVVSFDDARTELGLRHGENDGLASHHAIDKAKALLRAHEPFIWNATHLSTQMRSKTLDLLYAYDARVELVYLEQPPQVLYSRNQRRDSSLRNADIEGMLVRWEVPLPQEAHEVRYEVAGDDRWHARVAPSRGVTPSARED